MIDYLTNNIVVFIVRIMLYLVPKNKKIVVFGAFMGNRYGDNSAAFFEYCNTYKDSLYEYYWLSDSDDVVNNIRLEKRNAFLKKSIQGIWISIRANLFVTSHGVQDVLFYTPVSGRTTELYLHHGVPIRGALISNNGLSNKHFMTKRPKEISYMVTTSEWSGNQQRKNIPVEKSKIVITGYPRNDFFSYDSNLHEAIKSDLCLRGFTVLYAPTWRKWEATKFFPFEDINLKSLVSFLRENKITIILRPHSVDMRRIDDQNLINNVDWCDDVIKVITPDEYEDTQKLLMISDCLITDYSSIFYDYLLLNRPIIFVPYDKAEYTKRMGEFLVDYDVEIPGIQIVKQQILIDYLYKIKNNKDTYNSKRERLSKKVHKFSDGRSSERLFSFMDNVI